jgi:hypothetical protein
LFSYLYSFVLFNLYNFFTYINFSLIPLF